MSLPASDPALQAALAAAPAAAYSGVAFRAMPGGALVHNLSFEHLWAGGGAGRCNPAGIERLHLSAEKRTAQAEFRHHAAKGGGDPELAECYEFAAEVTLARVLDLTSGRTRKAIGITLVQITADWEADPLLPPPPPSRLQCIGYWISNGHGNFSAILYPSRRRRAGRNLVIFRNRLGPGDAIMPRSQRPTKSWP
jgi:RES domain-containing protein